MKTYSYLFFLIALMLNLPFNVNGQASDLLPEIVPQEGHRDIELLVCLPALMADTSLLETTTP